MEQLTFYPDEIELLKSGHKTQLRMVALEADVICEDFGDHGLSVQDVEDPLGVTIDAVQFWEGSLLRVDEDAEVLSFDDAALFGACKIEGIELQMCSAVTAADAFAEGVQEDPTFSTPGHGAEYVYRFQGKEYRGGDPAALIKHVWKRQLQTNTDSFLTFVVKLGGFKWL